jgi:hypothetical protein
MVGRVLRLWSVCRTNGSHIHRALEVPQKIVGRKTPGKFVPQLSEVVCDPFLMRASEHLNKDVRRMIFREEGHAPSNYIAFKALDIHFDEIDSVFGKIKNIEGGGIDSTTRGLPQIRAPIFESE